MDEMRVKLKVFVLLGDPLEPEAPLFGTLIYFDLESTLLFLSVLNRERKED